MKRLALLPLLLILAAGAWAEPAAEPAATDAQLLRRVELLLERSEAERRRLEGELLLREQQLRAGYEARIGELERQLAADGPAGAARPAAEQEIADLRRQVAERDRSLDELGRQVLALNAAANVRRPPGMADPSHVALREENAKLAAELQRIMLTPVWSPAAAAGPVPGGEGVLNVNAASREQLLAVPGMTAAAADFIVWYRARVGLFTGFGELRFLPDATPEAYGQWRRLLRAE